MSEYYPGTEIVETFYEYRGLTGLQQSDFAITLFNSGVISPVLVALTEIGSGWYRAAWTPTAIGDWMLDILPVDDDTVRYQGSFAVRATTADSAAIAEAVLESTVGEGTLRDYVDITKKYVANRLDIADEQYTLKKDDGTTTFATGQLSKTTRRPD